MSGASGRRFRWILPWALIISAIQAYAAQPTSTTSPSTQTTRILRRRVATVPLNPRPNNSIPGAAAIDGEQKKIREIYASDYTDTSFNARRALAQRMIEASDQTKHDTEAKFALLREARDVAAEAGDVTTAFEAVDHLAAAFPITKLTERIEVLKMAVPVLSSNTARIAAISICMDLVDQCVVEGSYDRAQALLSMAEDLARQAKSLPYLSWTDARSASLQPFVAAYELAHPAETKLAGSPDDPEANLVMGRFVAFVRGDIDAGLNMLAKGSDHDLAALAEKDLDTPDSAPDQFKTANAWWDLSGAQANESRDAMRRRAGFWYRKAVSGLDGLDRALANRRLQEINPPPKPGAKKEHPPDALKLTASPPHWYRASIAEVSWEAAQELCMESGGQLCCIETRAENDLMTKLSRARTLWLGATIDASGGWSWISGGPFFFVSWSPGEPVNVTPQSRIATGFGGMWHVQRAKAGFICEWSE